MTAGHLNSLFNFSPKAIRRSKQGVTLPEQAAKPAQLHGQAKKIAFPISTEFGVCFGTDW